MKKLLNKIKNAALYTWQLPQNLLGLALYHCYKGYEVCTKETCGECIKCKLSSNMRSGITLGNYIIVNNIKHLRHELGHTRQSKSLGPLYLLVIGLPSLIHAGLHSKVCKDKVDKYGIRACKRCNSVIAFSLVDINIISPF